MFENDGYEHYGRRMENYRLPKTEAARLGTRGQDRRWRPCLSDAIDAATQRPELVQLPKVAILR